MPKLTALNGTDADGYSLWVSATEEIDDNEIEGFLGGLSATPPGAIYTDSTTTCADVLSGYGDAFCE